MRSQKELFALLLNVPEMTDRTDWKKELSSIDCGSITTVVKSATNIPKKYSDFIENYLKPQVGLSNEECYKLIAQFFSSEFFGNKDELKQLFDNAQMQQELVSVIEGFHNSERTFKLFLIRDVLILRHNNPSLRCLEAVSFVDQCLKKFEVSLKIVKSLSLGDLDSNTNEVISRNVRTWYSYIQIMILDTREAFCSVNQLLKFLEVCNDLIIELQPFANKDSVKLSLFFDDLLKVITSFFIRNFDLSSIIVPENQNITQNQAHRLMKESKSVLDSISSAVLKVASALPIVGLSWYVLKVQFESVNEIDAKIGQISLKNNALNSICEHSVEPIYDNKVLFEIYQEDLFDLMRIVLSKFEYSNLFGKSVMPVTILGNLIRNERNAKMFFEDLEKHSDANIGFNSLFLSMLYSFPTSAEALFSLIGVACHSFSHVKLFNLVSGLNIEEKSVYDVDDVSINGWIFAKTCVAQFLLPTSEKDLDQKELQLALSIVKLVNRLLTSGVSLLPAIVQVLELLPQLISNLSRSCSVENFESRKEIIKHSLSCLKPLAKIRPELVLNELIQCDILPIKAVDESELPKCYFTDIIFPWEIKLGSDLSASSSLIDLLQIGCHFLLENQEHMTDIYQVLILTRELIAKSLVPELCSEADLRNKSVVAFLNKCLETLIGLLKKVEIYPAEWSDLFSGELCNMVMFSQFGSNLASVLQVGNERITSAFSRQLTYSSSNGLGTELINLINTTLELVIYSWNFKQPGSNITSIENRLMQESEGEGFKKVVSYLFHQFDYKLPVLACKFLKLLALNPNSSLFTFLHDLKEPIRDKFNRVLSKATEDPSLKSGIVELLISCVESQPALLDFLINLDCTTKKLGTPSVLQPILDVITNDNNGKIELSKLFLNIVEFVHVIWTESDAQIQLQNFVKSQPNFWPSLFKFLICPDVLNPDPKLVSVAGRIMKTVAIELRCLSTANGADELKSSFGKFIKNGQFFAWFDLAKQIVKIEKQAILDGNPNIDRNSCTFDDVCSLVSSMRQLLTSTLNRNEATKIFRQADKDELARALNFSLECLSSCLQLLISGVEIDSVRSSKVEATVVMVSLLVLNLIQQPDMQDSEHLEAVCEILSLSSTMRDFNFYQKFNLTMFACLNIIMQDEMSTKISSDPVVKSIINSANNVLKVVLQNASSNSNQESKLCPMSDIAITMLSMLFLRVTSTEFFLTQIGQSDLISNLVTLFQFSIYSEGNKSQMAYSVLSLFVHLSSYKISAEFLVKCNIHKQLCLALYDECSRFSSDNLPSTQKQSKEKNLLKAGHESCNCFSSLMVLSANLLSHAEAAYLEQSLDIVSCFEDRIVHNFSHLYYDQSEYFLNELLSVVQFVQRLSVYMKVWRYKLRDNFDIVTSSMATACQTCIALLIRPKYFQYLLTHGYHPSDRKRLSTSDSSGGGFSSEVAGRKSAGSLGRKTPTIGSSMTPAGASGASSSSLSRQRSLSSTILTTGEFCYTYAASNFSGYNERCL